MKTAKEWLESEEKYKYSDNEIWIRRMERYSNYTNKELMGLIMQFRDKLDSCSKTHTIMDEDNITDIGSEALGWRMEFDNHFKIEEIRKISGINYIK